MTKLPEGWQRATLSETCSRIVDGSHTPPKATEHGFPMLSARNIQARQIRFDDFRFISSPDFKRENDRTDIGPGDVLLTIVGAIGRTAVVPENTRPFALQRSVAVLKPRDTDPRYLGYALESPEVQRFLEENAKGTAQRGIYLKALGQVEIPLPPLAEQQRIADKLDVLLGRVDACRARLERVPAVLKRLRQAVLAAATSGRLTEEWRAQQTNPTDDPIFFAELYSFGESQLPELPETWKWYRFGDVASIESNLVDPSQYRTYPHIAPNHIESQTGRLLPYGTVESDNVKSGKHLFKPGQVLYSKIRPYLCKAVVVDFSGVCSADMYPISGQLVSSQYLHKWMISELFTTFASSQQGRTVLPKINQEALNEIPVPVPPVNEQHEIVRRVETLFAYADRLEARYAAARDQVEQLTPSLLAKAFRGELVKQE